jgi:hypothetical protein
VVGILQLQGGKISPTPFLRRRHNITSSLLHGKIMAAYMPRSFQVLYKNGSGHIDDDLHAWDKAGG